MALSSMMSSKCDWLMYASYWVRDNWESFEWNASCRSYLRKECWNFISCHRIQELFDNILGPCVAFLLLLESENNLRLAEMEIRLLLFVTEFDSEPTLFLTLDSFLDFLVSTGAAVASMQSPFSVFTRIVFLKIQFLRLVFLDQQPSVLLKHINISEKCESDLCCCCEHETIVTNWHVSLP